MADQSAYFTPNQTGENIDTRSGSQKLRRSARTRAKDNDREQNIGASPRLPATKKTRETNEAEQVTEELNPAAKKLNQTRTTVDSMAEHEHEPSNAQILRSLNGIAAKFETLANKNDLARVERELHNKLLDSSRNLKTEIRAEMKQAFSEQNEAVQRMVKEEVEGRIGQQMRADIAAQHREGAQTVRYRRSRRSIKIWPVKLVGTDHDTLVRQFFIDKLQVPPRLANGVLLDTIKRSEQTQNSKIKDEILVTFAEQDDRDAIKSYANKLADQGGNAGLRLDVPPHLKGSFKILNDHGLAITQVYGRGVKRSIKFDDRNENLMMDLKLPTSTSWQNITIEQARESLRIRDEINMRQIRAVGLAGVGNNNEVAREHAKALMLSLSPPPQGSGGARQPLAPITVNVTDLDKQLGATRDGRQSQHDDSINRLLNGMRSNSSQDDNM